MTAVHLGGVSTGSTGGHPRGVPHGATDRHPGGHPHAAASRRNLDFDGAPFIAIWETTQACDLACKHCPARWPSRCGTRPS